MSLSGRDPFSLYFHVPFCARKCPYCDFNTYAVRAAPEETYVSAMLKELEYRAVEEAWRDRELISIFFGGGTPTFFKTESLALLVAHTKSLFRDSLEEVSIEANPLDLSSAYIEKLFDAGFTRVSVGGQSFNDATLRTLGRDHSSFELEQALANLAKSPFENYSVDLIYGVPHQTAKEFISDLERALTCGASHFSAYSLTLERGTPFYQSFERGDMMLPEEDEVMVMIEALEELPKSNAFDRYEISNYSKVGAQSIHNIGYWEGRDYLGIGAGAHSFLSLEGSAMRWSNAALPQAYIKKIVTSREAVAWKDHLNAQILQAEFFLLGLRQIKGVSLKGFAKKFGIEADELFHQEFARLSSDGLIESKGEILRLTSRGLRFADSVGEAFVSEPRVK